MTGEKAADASESERDEREHSPVRTRRAVGVVYLKGLAMGTAATVPGVSGGTIALILGIYDRFIRALAALDTSILRLGPALVRPASRTRARKEVQARDLLFLVVLFVGIASAIITLARVMNRALSAYPGPTFGFFGGLIAASAVVLYDRRWLTRPRHGIAAVSGFSLAFVVAGATETGVFPETLWMVFLAASVAISGMVLPGLSGSFILLLLGQYEYLTGVLTDATDSVAALATGGSAEGLGGDLAVIGAFGTGAVIGFFTTAHAVRRALDRYPGATFAFLVSLMVGALRYPVAEIVEATEPAPGPVAVVVLSALVGASLVFAFERYSDNLGYDAYV